MEEDASAWIPITFETQKQWSDHRWPEDPNKKCDQEGSIKYAYTMFRFAGLACDFDHRTHDTEAPLAKLFEEVIWEIKQHFAQQAVAQARCQSRLNRDVADAAYNAAVARKRGVPWQSILPPKEKVLACRMIDPHGDLEPFAFHALLDCRRTDLAEITST